MRPIAAPKVPLAPGPARSSVRSLSRRRRANGLVCRGRALAAIGRDERDDERHISGSRRGSPPRQGGRVLEEIPEPDHRRGGPAGRARRPAATASTRIASLAAEQAAGAAFQQALALDRDGKGAEAEAAFAKLAADAPRGYQTLARLAEAAIKAKSDPKGALAAYDALAADASIGALFQRRRPAARRPAAPGRRRGRRGQAGARGAGGERRRLSPHRAPGAGRHRAERRRLRRRRQMARPRRRRRRSARQRKSAAPRACSASSPPIARRPSERRRRAAGRRGSSRRP